MNYRLAIFDFDGTLADSFPFFAAAFNELAAKHGFRAISPDELPALRHRSPKELMAHVGMPRWKLPIVAASFIALMRQNQHSIALFDGVPEALETIASAGVQLAIVSSNAEDNVREILGPVNVGRFTHFECGMSIFGKPARIRKVLQAQRVTPSEALYIGDQTTDLDAARSEGIAFGAVHWGYGTIESMRLLRPEEEFVTVPDLARIATRA